MKLYQYFFILSKIVILMMILLNTLYETNYRDIFTEFLENIFAIYLGGLLIFLFWPYKKNISLDKHDRLIAFSAGTLLILTKNYNTIAKEIRILVNQIIVK